VGEDGDCEDEKARGAGEEKSRFLAMRGMTKRVRLAPIEAIREYFIPEFSEWKDHDKYKKVFERLLGNLKARIT
jgi:hypothetical protein